VATEAGARVHACHVVRLQEDACTFEASAFASVARPRARQRTSNWLRSPLMIYLTTSLLIVLSSRFRRGSKGGAREPLHSPRATHRAAAGQPRHGFKPRRPIMGDSYIQMLSLVFLHLVTTSGYLSIRPINVSSNCETANLSIDVGIFCVLIWVVASDLLLYGRAAAVPARCIALIFLALM